MAASTSDQIEQQASSHLSETSISTTSDLNVTQLNGDDEMVNRRFSAVMNKCIEKIMTAARFVPKNSQHKHILLLIIRQVHGNDFQSF